MSLRLMLRMGLVVVLALGLMLSASASSSETVSAHGGDTTLGHACAESTSLFLNIVLTPGLIPGGDFDCTTLGAGWFNYDSGDISRVAGAAGSGITGGAASGEATLGTDPNVLQRRVTGICPVGQAIRVVDIAGAVTCQVAGSIGGAGTANRIAMFTGAGTIGNSAISQSGGNIGIGTTSPDNALHIKGSGIDGITLERSSTAQDTQIKFQNEIGDDKWRLSFDGDSEDLLLFPVGADRDLVLQADEAGTMFGNVGIGTTSPNEQLEITGNFRLPATTATTGIIMSDGNPFIHNFGTNNFFAGVNAGNLTTTGSGNTASGVGALQANTTGSGNTASGVGALQANTTGSGNMASGVQALNSGTTGDFNTAAGQGTLFNNTTGSNNTAAGVSALNGNTTGSNNTAIGFLASVSTGNLTNATAIGNSAIVNASNKIRLGNGSVTVIEGQVAYTFPSDVNQKENFRPVDAEETLEKISELDLESWNYKGHDPQQFRHYGPMAQDFFAAFGDDGFGTVGTDTTINSGDMAGVMLIAIQALEQRTADLESQRAQTTMLQQRNNDLEARLAKMERVLGVTSSPWEKE